MRLFRYRRGQIRGIDFSLAIIIFSLTITQILILTTTFIDGNRTLIELDQQSEITETLAVEMLHNSGFYSGSTDWATISTPELINSDWNLGLSTNGHIDPFKLGRLSNRSLSNYILDYNDISQGLNFSSSFRIEILNPIDIQIEAVGDDTLSTITVNGSVTKLSTPLNLAEVWVYSINSTLDVAQGTGFTNIDGDFSIDLTYITPLTLGDEFRIVAFTKYGDSSQDADIASYLRSGGSTSITESPISIFESSNLNEGYSVNVTSEFDIAIDSASIVAFYPGIASGTLNFTITDLTDNFPNLWTNDTVSIPQSGMTVFLGMGYSGSILSSISAVKFPVTLDNQHSASIEPPVIQAATSTSTLITLIVRELVLQLQFTTWEF